MSLSTILEPETSFHTQIKPRLDSYDSGEEFSLAHFCELRKLVEVDEHELDGYVFDDSCLT